MSRYQRATDRARAQALVRLAESPAGSFAAQAAELQLQICDLRDALNPIQRRLVQLLEWIHHVTSRRT